MGVGEKAMQAYSSEVSPKRPATECRPTTFPSWRSQPSKTESVSKSPRTFEKQRLHDVHGPITDAWAWIKPPDCRGGLSPVFGNKAEAGSSAIVDLVSSLGPIHRHDGMHRMDLMLCCWAGVSTFLSWMTRKL